MLIGCLPTFIFMSIESISRGRRRRRLGIHVSFVKESTRARRGDCCNVAILDLSHWGRVITMANVVLLTAAYVGLILWAVEGVDQIAELHHNLAASDVPLIRLQIIPPVGIKITIAANSKLLVLGERKIGIGVFFKSCFLFGKLFWKSF